MIDESNRIKTKADLDEWIHYEMSRYSQNNRGGVLAEFFELGEKAVICKFQKTLRKAEYYENTYQRIKALCYKIKLKKMQCKYSLHIPLNCCGKGLKIMHTGLILINEKAAIGCNCVFHINTSVVAGKPNNSAPTIGNGVCGSGISWWNRDC